METKGKNLTTKVIVLVSYVLMIVVNALANTLPLNGITTGEISNNYENLFAPTGFTFAIWGLIYLLLAAYTLYQLGLFGGNKSAANERLLSRVGILFSISSLANAAWIFCWHYDYIPLSMLLMVIILLCLIFINEALKKETLNSRDKFFISLPFSVYFGWITVATVANVTVLLVSLGWDGFGIAPEVWTVIVLVVAALIGGITSIVNRDVAYGGVIIWAYAGILVKHISTNGYSGEYPAVVTTIIACLLMLTVCLFYILFPHKRVRGQRK